MPGLTLESPSRKNDFLAHQLTRIQDEVDILISGQVE